MRLCRFGAGDGASVGLVEDGAVYDLRALGPSLLSDPAAALAAGAERLADVAARAPARALEEVTLLAPAQPRKFLGIGLNYADHIAESGRDVP
jgi:2-keto-4-pentenoate hydratase/2-oxohepta-3-ene-1,7-dioic acid hydratase in catechol pathway